MATLRVKTVQMRKTVNAPLVCSTVREEDVSRQRPCAMEQMIVPMEMMKKIAVRYYVFIVKKREWLWGLAKKNKKREKIQGNLDLTNIYKSSE